MDKSYEATVFHFANVFKFKKLVMLKLDYYFFFTKTQFKDILS